MSARWTQLTLPLSTSSAEASPVKTSVPPARELALLVLEAACGTSSNGLFEQCVLDGSSSRTWRAERSGGWTRSVFAWNSSTMKRYRSRLRRAMSERRTCGGVCLLLPTPSGSAYGTSGNGCPGDGRAEYAHKGKPSLHTMARKGLLPTPLASEGDSGANPNHAALRKGKERLRDVVLYPTPTVGDAKASGSRRSAGSKAKPGVSLTDVVVHGRSIHGDQHEGRVPNCGHLSPRFVEWMMGLQLDWTVPD
jgi:hypothetical protein